MDVEESVQGDSYKNIKLLSFFISLESGDDYDPEQNENQNTSMESDSSSEPDEEAPQALSPPPGAAGPSWDPEFQWKIEPAKPQRFPFVEANQV